MEKSVVIRLLAGFVLFAAALIIKPASPVLEVVLYAIPYLLVGWDILYFAGRNILKGRVFDEYFLMSIATVGAFAVGKYSEAVAVMLFYQIGEYLQERAVEKSRRSIAALMDIRPDVAFVVKNGVLERVSPEQVKVGDIIAVSPGDKIPVDGVVVEGASAVDTSAITGEPLPRDVLAGSEVLSGCVNQTGFLKIQVKKEYRDSTVSKILELVENSVAKKASREKFITKFARVYTPAVVAFAAMLAFLPPVFTGDRLEIWIYRALVFLVIACPCALVISVPLAFFVGIGGASRLGILIKGGSGIDALSKTETVVFDKTGTLTSGEFTVFGIRPSSMPADKLLYYAAHAEYHSNHPISKSIRTAFGEIEDIGIISNIREIPGYGVSALVGGDLVLAGSMRLMTERGVAVDSRFKEHAGSAVHVAVNGEYAGLIEVSDTTKPDAAEAVKELKSIGVKNTVMLTGDNRQSAEKAAGEIGIDTVYSELLPSDKVEIIEKLLRQKSKGTLAYAGDGINDAPALARADVGIAMGGFGSDAAIEASDVVIMTDEPLKIPRTIRLARRTLGIAKQNIFIALAVKGAVLLLGALGIATMWQAVFADVGVTLIAILNSIRARSIA